MYYVVFCGILLVLIAITWSYYIKNKDAIVNGTKKMLDTPVRGGVPKNEFPLWQQFIYCVYWFVIFFCLSILPFIISVIVVKYNYDYYIPADAIYGNACWDLSVLMDGWKPIFYYFTFIAGIVPILFLIEFIFHRGFLKKMDDAGPKMAFANYSKQENIFYLLICITVFAILFGTNFNSYQYCTENEIVIKRFYKFKEERFRYDDIDKIVKELYNSDDGTIPYRYVAWFKNGDKFAIGNSDCDDVSKLEKVFDDKIIYVEIDDSRIY